MQELTETTSELLSSWLMLSVWLVPFGVSLWYALKRKDRRLTIIALFCIPFLIYFGWAVTDLWETHATARTFNRSAQVLGVSILMLLIYGIARYEC